MYHRLHLNERHWIARVEPSARMFQTSPMGAEDFTFLIGFTVITGRSKGGRSKGEVSQRADEVLIRFVELKSYSGWW